MTEGSTTYSLLYVKITAAILFVLFGLLIHANVQAQSTEVISEELQVLQDEIDSRKSEMDDLNSQIDSYKQRINAAASRTASLRNDIDFIDTQITLAELDVAATQVDIETQQLEIQLLERRIAEESERLAEQKLLLEEILFDLHRKDEFDLIEILFGSRDFHELFQEVEQLEVLSDDLHQTVESTKQTRLLLEEGQLAHEGHLDELLELESELITKLAQLEAQQGAKETLLVQTQDSEEEYRILLSDLRAEQSSITSSIASLQIELQARIDDTDSLGDASLFTSPLPNSILTAYFHDPTYPFRHLFEHSGIDLAAPTGTPIYASAPGIVAWARSGRSYGNYAIIIHQGGFSTLYAHMNTLNVSADQFVSRGEVIGTVGSTGFSTGPHLHFEIRSNGIPVNPAAYLIDF